MLKIHSPETKAICRRGFTLVELVLVILIMGIIAAVALPKAGEGVKTARVSSAKTSLSGVRTAIDNFKSITGAYPPDASTLPALVNPYLKGSFPPAPLGANAGSIIVTEGTDPPTVIAGNAGWAYIPATGDFYLNDASALSW